MLNPAFDPLLNALKSEMERRSLDDVRKLRLIISVSWHCTEEQRYELLQTLLCIEDVKKLPQTKKINEEFDRIIKDLR